MKHISVLALFVAFPFIVPTAYAQEAETEFRTRFMMLNRHQCANENMEEVMEISRTLMAPILEDMVDEGAIHDWGFMTHAWGDEYNYNFYIIAESHRAFLDAWDTLIARANEEDPEWFDRFGPLCQAHKDNMFTLHDYADE